jgi:Brp/Blh family beta-carotene 15,15'-monooxygenase
MTAWLPQAQRRHTRIATAIVTGACVLAFAPPGITAQAAILVGGVALVGMPHGSFDHLVARRALRARLGWSWWVAFAVGYGALAGLVWAGWRVAPAATLTLFLALSVLHFGLGDADAASVAGLGRRAGAVIARGALPVLLPLSFHRAAVMPFMTALAGSGAAADAMLIDARWLLLPWGLCLVAWWPDAARAERREALALMAAFVLLPPLLAFALYFCVCHSVRHLLRLGAMLSPGSAAQAWVRGLAVAVPAALLCLVGAAAFAAHGAEAEVAPMLRLLAALTLPHMVVTLLLEQRA